MFGTSASGGERVSVRHPPPRVSIPTPLARPPLPRATDCVCVATPKAPLAFVSDPPDRASTSPLVRQLLPRVDVERGDGAAEARAATPARARVAACVAPT